MLSLLIVLSLIISAINIINYVKTCKDSDETISIIRNSEGPFGPGALTPPPVGGNVGPNGFDREMTFRTRYFTITFDSNGNVVKTNLDNIALPSEEAFEIAKAIYEKNSSKGFYEQYRFNVFNDGDNKEVFLLDCTKERSSNNAFLVTSLIISFSSFLVVSIIMVIVSKIVVKPFYQNMEKQKRFITDASHELKTPLTIMNADIEVLEIESGKNEWLESIKVQVDRLTSMTKKLTLMNKMEEEGTNFALSNFDLSSKLNETFDDFTTLLSTKDKKLVTDVEEGIYLHGNEELMKELFFIMLENAYKYSLGDVYVSLKKENKLIKLEFSNDASVPDGNLDYLFDRFYRMDESRNSKTGGNGIGLSIAKSIVEINKGTISATGNNNRIKFLITFKN